MLYSIGWKMASKHLFGKRKKELDELKMRSVFGWFSVVTGFLFLFTPSEMHLKGKKHDVTG